MTATTSPVRMCRPYTARARVRAYHANTQTCPTPLLPLFPHDAFSPAQPRSRISNLVNGAIAALAEAVDELKDSRRVGRAVQLARALHHARHCRDRHPVERKSSRGPGTAIARSKKRRHHRRARVCARSPTALSSRALSRSLSLSLSLRFHARSHVNSPQFAQSEAVPHRSSAENVQILFLARTHHTALGRTTREQRENSERDQKSRSL